MGERRRAMLHAVIFAIALTSGCANSEDGRGTGAPINSSNPSSPPADPFWQGLERHEIQLEQTLLVVKGSRGVVACPYLNVETFIKTGEACAIVPAKNIDGMPDSHVTAVTPAAEALGIRVGMSGREALDKIR